MAAPIKRDESPIGGGYQPSSAPGGLNKPSPTADSKPKLFKGGGTNPFAKRSGAGAGASAKPAVQEENKSGLFFPG